jgi:hypothetical protein
MHAASGGRYARAILAIMIISFYVPFVILCRWSSVAPSPLSFNFGVGCQILIPYPPFYPEDAEVIVRICMKCSAIILFSRTTHRCRLGGCTTGSARPARLIDALFPIVRTHTTKVRIVSISLSSWHLRSCRDLSSRPSPALRAIHRRRTGWAGRSSMLQER